MNANNAIMPRGIGPGNKAGAGAAGTRYRSELFIEIWRLGCFIGAAVEEHLTASSQTPIAGEEWTEGGIPPPGQRTSPGAQAGEHTLYEIEWLIVERDERVSRDTDGVGRDIWRGIAGITSNVSHGQSPLQPGSGILFLFSGATSIHDVMSGSSAKEEARGSDSTRRAAHSVPRCP